MLNGARRVGLTQSPNVKLYTRPAVDLEVYFGFIAALQSFEMSVEPDLLEFCCILERHSQMGDKVVPSVSVFLGGKRFVARSLPRMEDSGFL